ncbi:RdRp [Leshenault partiti-like virus]|uniref:RdRp n=1 Tax=Leshenault partiti-like virus TaxID=2010278 RepID=UPI000B4F7053|nr:RdRp [Leshenault partiti-like virus]ASA47356.1 RdRp [Leshenault partiti-like virus]
MQASRMLESHRVWGEYRTHRLLEAHDGRATWLRAWTKSWAPRQGVVESTPEAEKHVGVMTYVKGWRRRLRRQLRSARTQFEREVVHGSWAALEGLYSEALEHSPTMDLMYGHVLSLSVDRDHGFTRSFPSWYVSPAGFENVPIVKRTTAKDPFTRMVETGPTGIVARTMMKVGGRPQKFTDAAATSLAYKWLHATGLWSSVTDADVVINVSASFDTSRVHMEKFTAPRPPTEGTLDMCWEVVARNFKELGMTGLPWITVADVIAPHINGDACPGLLTSRIYRTRAQASSCTTSDVVALFEALRTQELLCALPWAAGGREKRQERLVGDQVSSRLVQMPEDVLARLESAVAGPLLQRLKWVKRDIALGMSFFRGRAQRFFHRFDTCTHVKSFDWSAFDSSVGETLIVASFSLLRACYPEGQHADNVFKYILSAFVHKHLIVPQGDVIGMHRGIPSGSGLTSLVGSVANWLILRTTLTDICPPLLAQRAEVAVLGDDTLIGFRGYDGIPTNAEFTARAFALWGVAAGPSPSMVYPEGPPRSVYLERCQTFLSVTSWCGLPSWRNREWWVMDMGYAKGQPDVANAQVAALEDAGFSGFAPQLRGTRRRFQKWLQKQPGAHMLHPEYVESTETITQGWMARAHSSTGTAKELAAFDWDSKGQHPGNWPTRWKVAAEAAPPPHKAEVLYGAPGTRTVFELNWARTRKGKVGLRLPVYEGSRAPVLAAEMFRYTRVGLARVSEELYLRESGIVPPDVRRGRAWKCGLAVAILALGAALGYTVYARPPPKPPDPSVTVRTGGTS